MDALKQTIRDEAYEEAAKSFAYTTVIWHPEWDLSYLGDHLTAQIAKWRADAQANRAPVEEHHAAVAPVGDEVLVVPVPSLEVLLGQVIEGDQGITIHPAESYASIEQIDNPNSIVDRQE